MRYNDIYDSKLLFRSLRMFVLMVVLMKLTGGSGFVVFLLMTIVAIMQRKPERLLVLLLVSSSAMIGNYLIMPKNSIFIVTQKAMVLLLSMVLMIRLAGQRHSHFLTPFLGVMPFLCFMVLSSAQGWNPLISYLKMFLFISCFFAFYGVANAVILNARMGVRTLRSVYLSLCCFMIFGSMLLIPFPALSQMQMSQYVEAIKSGAAITSLFCGMAVHSQSLGPLVAIMAVMLLSDMLFSLQKVDKLFAVLLLCCPYLIYKTSSRTAMGTLLAGAFFAMFLFMRARRMSSRWRGKVVSAGLILAILGSCALFVSSPGRRAVAKYVLKSEGAQTLESAVIGDVMSSRQGLIDVAMEGFRAKPLIGNGFQVSRDFENMPMNNIKSLLSAPIEKGVWVAAILEEGGVVGMVFFVLFGLTAIVKLVSRKAYIAATILFTVYVVNLGEFSIFSMSGIGGFYWCLCFVGAALDAVRQRQLQILNDPPVCMC